MFFELFILFVVLPLFFLAFVTFATFVLIPCAFIFASWYMRIKERKLERRKRDGANVAFFHPYCNGGGGGERVLWVAIKALLTRYPDIHIYVYTVETAEAKTIIDKVQNQFNVKLDVDKINFIRLSMKNAIDPASYPYLTLLMQSLGSIGLGMEAFMKFNPDIYIDTTGFAFTYPIFRYLAACPVGTYTHYPTITSAMMRRVKHRVAAHNNSSLIARNPLLTWCKILYYKMFGMMYRWVGRCADVVLVNGTWTEEHINELWGRPLSTHRVYPPCEVSELKKLRSLVRDSDPIRILSVAQFRPEKDHPLMLQALYELRNLLMNNDQLWGKIKLVLVGSARSASEQERVRNLRDLAAHLSVDGHVQFVLNAPYAQLLQLYQTSTMAIHTMWNEHFGISVVECMAAGLITIAHRSGGPLADIIETAEGSRTGFLAAEPAEYARAILEVIALPQHERNRIIEAARASVDRFSESEFEKAFIRTSGPLFTLQ
ncbi:GDP-Man:Man(3)GlcNAc(2)-PP-Dol alpha-1,2-mannosyltransferase isoform X2 [Aricia agestis]|uniref:GDP-Man:Man(3)GlcNAc(2)-PP-Dol alpha-1,2-mannosyltransferase isoform X2 n=1 Tax=Aricia agestis TaxID=91739 RepID=UPI001C203F19|nr:GDP-Man:Man(3)GlcNAc(2)-PP-Dol alpha-1,2-mannosyltransferase isoform X2 [Aricia agestis]